MAQVRFKNKNTGELSTVASGGSAQDIIASKDPNYWEVVGEMPSITTKPVGLISTKDSINQVNKDVGKFQSMTGTSLNSPAVQGLLSNVATKLKATLPAEQPTQEKTQPVENKNAYSLEDAYSLWGGDFSGLTQNQDGTYTPDKTAISRLGITGLKTNEEDTTQKTLEGAVSSVNTQIQSLTSDLVNYNVDNDPEYQSAANSIRQQYEKLRQNMLQANEQRAGALKTLGYRTGAQQYAGSVQMGIEGEELTQANERMSEIARQENDAIAAARSAYKSGQYAEFNAKINALENIRQTKAEELNNYNNLLVEKNKAVAEQNKFNLEVLKYQQDAMTNDTKEYEYAKNQGFEGDILDYFAAKEELKAQNPNTPSSYLEWTLAGGEAGTGKTYGEFIAKAGARGPASYQEWSLAGGQAGTGKSYAEWVGKDKGIDTSTLTKVQTIANSFDGEQAVKNYQVSAEAIDAIKNAGTTPTDDISRVYAFAKVMDPNSVVREGEYKTVQDYSTALFERMGLKAKRVFDNTGFLTQEARDFMLKTLNNRLASSEKAYKNIYNEYGRRINKLTGSNDGTEYLPDYSKAFTDYQAKLDDGVNSGKFTIQDEQKAIQVLNENHGNNWTEEDLYNYLLGDVGFNNVGGDTNTATGNYKVSIAAGIAKRTNNPGNLVYIGQAGAKKDSSSRFAVFDTPEDGFRALINDLNAKKAVGGKLGPDSTLAQLISVYAPPSENATSTYIKQIASALGISPNTKISNIDTFKLAKAIAKKESSTIIS